MHGLIGCRCDVKGFYKILIDLFLIVITRFDKSFDVLSHMRLVLETIFQLCLGTEFIFTIVRSISKCPIMIVHDMESTLV